MTSEERKRMNELCVEIQQEKDFHRYEELIRELSSLVAKKERRFPERSVLTAHHPGQGMETYARFCPKAHSHTGWKRH